VLYIFCIPAALAIYSTTVFDDFGMSPCFNFITSGDGGGMSLSSRIGKSLSVEHGESVMMKHYLHSRKKHAQVGRETIKREILREDKTA
jgi:hypothetical protein